MAVLNADPFIHSDTASRNDIDKSMLNVKDVKRIILTYMSSVDSVVTPTANACCFPSAITAYIRVLRTYI